MDISERKFEQIVEDINLLLMSTVPRLKSRLDPDTELYNGGASLDSIQIIELVLAVEQHYNIKFRPELLSPDNLSSLGELANMLTREFK